MLFVLSPVTDQEANDLLGARARKSEQKFNYSGSEELQQTSWDPRESMDERTALAVKTVSHSTSKVGRNEPCPCGSGKKYKKCCGG